MTGASGFVGRHLLVALRSAFPNALLIAASRYGNVAGWDQSVTLDLLDQESCAKAVAWAAPDVVLHLAARAAVGGSFTNPMPSWQANLFGTLALAEAVWSTARDSLFVYVSSAEVYGLSFQTGKALTEDALMQPANPYAASKAAADLAIGEMALRGLRTVRVRPFNHTGAGQSAAFVVPNFARQVALIAGGKQEPVLRVGALDRWRDFLDVADVCAGYAAVLQAEDRLEPGMIFNLASGNPIRIGDILDDLLRLANVEARIEAEETLLRPTDVLRTEGNAFAAKRILGWTPSTPWEVTLATVLVDWRKRTA